MDHKYDLQKQSKMKIKYAKVCICRQLMKTIEAEPRNIFKRVRINSDIK